MANLSAPQQPKSLLAININKPRYDQETYEGRAKHFFLITNPLNILASSSALENAKQVVTLHKNKQSLPESLTEDDLWRAKILYDSAFHPDTGEKMVLIGRMSAQVPMNMLITGGMLCFYKSTPAVIFWQWINQSFNAVVNYTNRSGDNAVSDSQLLTSYVCATGGALVTALSLNRMVKNLPPIAARLVPFTAVAAANCVNIPLMRLQELQNGTPIYGDGDEKLGYSKIAARDGITQVIFSRICMAAPGMMLTPFVMNYLERRGALTKVPWVNLPLQLGLVGLCLTFATPLACAVFKQKAEIKYKDLETELQEHVAKQYNGKPPHALYYNKGL